MNRISKRISIAGVPNAFDYSCFDSLLAVSSLKSVSLYSGTSVDSPVSELFYELPCGLTLSGFQKSKGGVFSCLSDDTVSVFKVTNCVRTIHEAIVTPGRIFDSCWSPFHIDSLATCCDSGFLSLWDLRSVSSASLQVATGKLCYNVKWCPFNENLLSFCCDGRYLMVWDIRMTNSAKPNCLHIIEPTNAIQDYAWDDSKPCLFMSSCRSTVECWSFNNTQCDDACDLRQTINCDTLTRRSQLLPHPRGEGLLLSNTMQRRIQFVEMHPPITEDVLWDTGFSERVKSISFEAKQSLVGMQWVGESSESNKTDLLLLTESAMVHRLNFDSSTVAVASSVAAKTFTLRNSRHLVGGVSKEEQEANSSQVTATPGTTGFNTSNNTASGRKSASRHPSAANAASSAATAAKLLAAAALTKEVVGPTSFTNLLEHEINSLDAAIRGGLMDGLKIERFDQIGRRIVLDLLIPSIDPFLVRSKVHDGSYSNYYRPEELHQFVKKSSQSHHHHSHYGHSSHRLVSLLISFSSKLVTFWTPTFLIDNKCGIDVSLFALLCDLFVFLLVGR